MTLNNFHQHISPKIYARGEEYYKMGMIDNVEHNHPDIWTAEVSGNELYFIEIKLNDDEIISWSCDCPYDYGDMCKHTVAVLLYIKENRHKHPVSIEIPSSPAQEQLTEILKQTDKKELTSFLSQYADKHPDFHQTLISHLHPNRKTTHKTDYAKEIQKCFKYSYHDDGFSYGMSSISRKLDKYIEKAKSLAKLNCLEEAITILLHIINETGDNYEEYNDYNGDLASVCQEAADLVAEMIETGLPDDLLKRLSDEISQLIKNDNYANYDLADLNHLLLLLTSKTLNFDKAIQIIEETLKNETDSFRTPSLVVSIIELLEKAGKKEDVENVISSYLYLPEIRKIRLKSLLSQKQYEEAIDLINEGITVAEKKGHSGTVSDWKDEKLSLYWLMGKQKKVIELAEDLFVSGRENMKYYHLLKTLISAEKWAAYLDDFLIQSGKKQKWGLNGDLLTAIYIEEKYWNRLMDYVEKNMRLVKNNYSLAKYESYLKPLYPERMLAFYHSQLTNYAANNIGREHYKYVSDVLKTMKTYPGGNEVANTLLTHFKSIYSNRRAMMEELGK